MSEHIMEFEQMEIVLQDTIRRMLLGGYCDPEYVRALVKDACNPTVKDLAAARKKLHDKAGKLR